MTCKGIARGKLIELEEPLPFSEGQRLKVSVEPTQDDAHLGSPTLVLEAVSKPPHLDCADVDEFERAIDEGRLSVRPNGVFDIRD